MVNDHCRTLSEATQVASRQPLLTCAPPSTAGQRPELGRMTAAAGARARSWPTGCARRPPTDLRRCARQVMPLTEQPADDRCCTLPARHSRPTTVAGHEGTQSGSRPGAEPSASPPLSRMGGGARRSQRTQHMVRTQAQNSQPPRVSSACGSRRGPEDDSGAEPSAKRCRQPTEDHC